MSDITSPKNLADRTIDLEEEVKALKVLSAQPYVICKQAKEIRIYPEPGTAPSLEEREDDVLYFCKIEELGEMVLVCNIPSANYALDLSPWLSSAPGDGTTDISIDWGDNASTVAYAFASLEKPSASKKFEVYSIEEREDEPVIEKNERFVEETELDSLMEAKSDLAVVSSVDYPVVETPGTGTITHTYTTAGEYRITLKGSFKWGLGEETSNLALQNTLTSIELPSSDSPIKHVATYAFYGCSALTSIPQGLFDKCTAVTSFASCFENCTSLTSIPQSLFNKCTAVTDFDSCFYDCTKLTRIPAGLFDNCTKVKGFSGCFFGCSVITSIPAGLFDNCPKVTDFTGCFWSCSALKGIPAGLFAECPNVTSFYGCFYDCTAITSIPQGLFDKCTAVTSFSYCFQYCSALTSIPAGLFDKCTAVTDFNQCFYNCSAITSIPAGLFDKCTKVTNFYYCFCNCTTLTSIPQDLFNNCPNVTNFAGCFYNCSEITSALPTLWFSHDSASHARCFYNCTKATTYWAAHAAGWV